MKVCYAFFMFYVLVGCVFGEVSFEKVRVGLSSGDQSEAAAAVDSCVEAGEEVLPKLREWAGDVDPRLKSRARHALGRVTGQWGSQTGVIWKRSMADGVNGDKPLLVLHLFGKLDEEFC